MKILPVQPPLYSRLVWMTPAAKARWADVVQNINAAWGAIERELVLDGYREACQQPLGLRDYEEALKWGERHDMNVGTVRVVKPWQGFAHRYESADESDPSALRVTVMTRDPNLCAAFMRDGTLTDDEQGAAFGYPACCRAWFMKVFPAFADPVWQTAENSTSDCVDTIEDYKIVLKQNYLTNPYMRYCGVRLTNHIPCSMNCEASEKIAWNVLEVAKKYHGEELARDMVRLLSMNLEWTALKGLAIIKTPILQICNGSVPCYPKHTVQLVQSDPELAYPEHSAQGVVFPYLRTC